MSDGAAATKMPLLMHAIELNTYFQLLAIAAGEDWKNVVNAVSRYRSEYRMKR